MSEDAKGAIALVVIFTPILALVVSMAVSMYRQYVPSSDSDPRKCDGCGKIVEPGKLRAMRRFRIPFFHKKLVKGNIQAGIDRDAGRLYCWFCANTQTLGGLFLVALSAFAVIGKLLTAGK